MLNAALTKNNNSGQTRISILVSPLSKSPCKLLNRVVPTGTLRGVEGEGKISPIRLCIEKFLELLTKVKPANEEI